MVPIKPVNHTSWVAVVTFTDRLKSVHNRCVLELYVTLFVLSLCPFDRFAGVGAFVKGLSHVSSFFSMDKCVSLCSKTRFVSTKMASKM